MFFNVDCNCLCAGPSPCQYCPDWASDANGYVTKCWEVTIAGVTNGTCSVCVDFNRAWNLAHLVGCSFAEGTPNTEYCNSGQVGGVNLATEVLVGVLTWRLYFRVGFTTIIAEYQLADISWDCEGPNVMSLVSSDGTCSGWPSTVTVEFVTCT